MKSVEIPSERAYIWEVDATLIVAIKPEYEWDIMSVRVQKLLLKNHVCIENAVDDLKL